MPFPSMRDAGRVGSANIHCVVIPIAENPPPPAWIRCKSAGGETPATEAEDLAWEVIFLESDGQLCLRQPGRATRWPSCLIFKP